MQEMNITVRYFGMVQELLSLDKEPLAVDPDTSVKTLRSRLESRYPALSGIDFAVAVNQELAAEDTTLPAGAEVALLPPFAGG